MLLRFGFLYSCFMIAAGSSLLAELPAEPIPTIAASPAIPAEPTPVPAEPTQLKATAYGREAEPKRLVHPQAPSQPASLADLQKKQQDLTRLQNEVSLLRSELGVASHYQAEILLAEVSLNQLKELDPQIQGEAEDLSVVDLLENLKQHRTLPTLQYRALKHCLKMTGVMRTLAEPSLLVEENSQSAFISGGEFPVPVARDSIQTVSYRPIGTSCLLTVKPAEGAQLKVSFAVEHSIRDEQNGIHVDGNLVPGMTARCFRATCTVSSGQTILSGGQVRNDQGEPVCLLMALTVTPVDSPELLTAPPLLQPIPEAAPAK